MGRSYSGPVRHPSKLVTRVQIPLAPQCPSQFPPAERGLVMPSSHSGPLHHSCKVELIVCSNHTEGSCYTRDMNLCLHCGEKTKNPKYCSLSCGAYAQTRDKKPVVLVPCQECGEGFVRKSKTQKYCTSSCSAKQNNRINPKRTAVRAKCLTCGEPVKTSVGIYCSRACAYTARAADSLAEWLETGVAASMAFGSPIRNYLYVQQANTCALCPCTTEWQGLSLRFVLDHISGDSSDNTRANLRLICPNCDSQLDTYKSKNKGNGRHSRRLRYVNGQSY